MLVRGQKKRSISGRVGSSTNFPYASATSAAERLPAYRPYG
ncbi:hypothetical protein ACIPUC_26130 [Streptomyces sp. LARHCF249]